MSHRSTLYCHVLSAFGTILILALREVGKIDFYSSKMPHKTANSQGQVRRSNWGKAKDYCDKLIVIEEAEQVHNGCKSFQTHGLQTVMVQ